MQLLRCLVLLGVLISFIPAALPAQADESVPIIIDTDMGNDDWMAILFLLHHPGISVQAITVDGNGLAHCEAGVRNAQGLLMLADQPTIPVACGRETPLVGDHAFPDAWRMGADTMSGMTLPENPNPPSELTAVELISQTLQKVPARVGIVTLGSLTTLAEVFASDPSLTGEVLHIWTMGGAIRVPGNLFHPGRGFINEYGEYNIWIDPLAADQVFKAGVPMTLIPLDATNDVPMTREFLAVMEGDHTTPAADFIYELISTHQEIFFGTGWYFWDPLAAAVATDYTLVTSNDTKLGVVTEEGEENGRTKIMRNGGQVNVATEPKVYRFQQTFWNVLNGRVPSADIPGLIPPDAAALLKNIPYVEGGSNDQSLDVFPLMTAESPTPVAILLPDLGQPRSDDGSGGFLNGLGYAAILMSYRSDGLAVRLEDMVCAIAWIQTNAATHNLDPNRIVLFGRGLAGSSAALVAAIEDPGALAPDCPLTGDIGVRGVVVSNAPLGNPETPLSLDHLREQMAADYGITLDDLDQALTEMSALPPLEWNSSLGGITGKVAASTPLYWLSPNDPAFFVIRENEDVEIPVSDGEVFAQTAQGLGIAAQFVDFATGEGSLDFEDFIARLTDFLAEVVE